MTTYNDPIAEALGVSAINFPKDYLVLYADCFAHFKQGDRISPFSGQKHSAETIAWMNSPEQTAKRSAYGKKGWEDPAFVTRMSQPRPGVGPKISALWNVDTYRTNMIKANERRWQRTGSREQAAAIMSSTMKLQWSMDEYRSRMTQLRKEEARRPEEIERRSKQLSEQWKDPEFREMQIQRSKEQAADRDMAALGKKAWDDAEFAARMRQPRPNTSASMKELYKTDPKRREIARQPKPGTASAMKAAWADPIRRAEMLEARRRKKDARRNSEAGSANGKI